MTELNPDTITSYSRKLVHRFFEGMSAEEWAECRVRNEGRDLAWKKLKEDAKKRHKKFYITNKRRKLVDDFVKEYLAKNPPVVIEEDIESAMPMAERWSKLFEG